MGENILVINNLIMNYFADRQLTEKVLNDIEKTIQKRCFYCKSCALCVKFRTYRNEFCKKCFWTVHKETNIGMSMIQTGAAETLSLN